MTEADNSYWMYDYDALGQVESAQKFNADGTSIPGLSYNYTYDTIGNRKTSNVDGTTNTYFSNSLNQYDSISNQAPNGPVTSFSLDYDVDGNLQQDDVWHYTWDANNRLSSITRLDGSQKLEFDYDFQGRRFTKTHICY